MSSKEEFIAEFRQKIVSRYKTDVINQMKEKQIEPIRDRLIALYERLRFFSLRERTGTLKFTKERENVNMEIKLLHQRIRLIENAQVSLDDKLVGHKCI